MRALLIRLTCQISLLFMAQPGCGRVSADLLRLHALSIAPSQNLMILLADEVPHLKGYWQTEIDFTDQSGSGNNLVGASGLPTITSSSFLGRGASLFSPGQSLQIGTTGSFAPPFITISVWAKYSAAQTVLTNGSQSILHASHGGNPYGAVFGLSLGNSGDISFEIGGVNGGSASMTYSPGVVAPNVWTHIAATYDGSTLKTYANGALVNQVSYAGGPISYDPSYTQVLVGQKWPNGPPFYDPMYFDGSLDELAIWDVALTSDEINKIYSAQAR